MDSRRTTETFMTHVTPITTRLRFDKLTMEFRRRGNAKLIIFRNDRDDTPHVTASWENRSKQVDVHLTSRAKAGHEEHRRIAAIDEQAFIKLFTSYEPAFLENLGPSIGTFRGVRPGWLGRKGYVVFYLDSEERKQFVERIVPRSERHGKSE